LNGLPQAWPREHGIKGTLKPPILQQLSQLTSFVILEPHPPPLLAIIVTSQMVLPDFPDDFAISKCVFILVFFSNAARTFNRKIYTTISRRKETVRELCLTIGV
jgi:hypothetical protein